MQNYFLRKPLLWLLLVLLAFITGCSSKANSNNQKNIITINTQPSSDKLFFNGSIKPIKVYTITSPADSTIAEKFFNYGQQVKKNELVMTITSTQLQQDYQSALTEYLKSKQQYNTSQVQIAGNEELNQLGIISKNEYLTAKNSFNDAALAFLQAKQKLQSILDKIPAGDTNIAQLKITDIESVNKALSNTFSKLKILAPETGIALVPEKSSSSSGNDSGAVQKLDVGSQVKSGQMLLAIGDMSGIIVEININEVDINRIKPGQEAIITGIGFPEFVLHGQVKSVDIQATPSLSNNLPAFPIKVAVPKLTEQQSQKIHVGMSAKVELTLTHPTIIILPIKAVFEKNGKSMVKVLNQAIGKAIEKPVTTGHTTLDSVEIESGLDQGDHVVVPD